ncbi:MAG: DNA adenine methylase [Roseiflexaceae bacterium]|nr:DNA adenine methylase [Roseiflexaceae bacterium]
MARSSSRGDSPAAVRPFIKWAGGKGQLLPKLSARLPSNFGRYHEPFVGGAALFFHLHNNGLLRHGATLSDFNAELVGCYQVVRDQVEQLIALLCQHHEQRFSREYFLDVRSWDRQPGFYERYNQIERVARTIFLNRTCYNGLYRLNRKGQFNAPFGYYKNPRICDGENLRAVSAALQGVELRQADFAEVLQAAEPGDLVYFDPPYVPLSATAAFTTYTGRTFGQDDQRRLAGVVRALAERGVHVMLSNSDTPISREIYLSPAFQHETVLASRKINCDGRKRGSVEELIVWAYA